jgi:hypothetical protein
MPRGTPRVSAAMGSALPGAEGPGHRSPRSVGLVPPCVFEQLTSSVPEEQVAVRGGNAGGRATLEPCGTASVGH